MFTGDVTRSAGEFPIRDLPNKRHEEVTSYELSFRLSDAEHGTNG